MKKYVCFAGIDVSKSKLDVTLLADPSEKKAQHFVVPNGSKGIQQILSAIKKSNFDLQDTLFSFEDTGVYSLPLCFFLVQKQLDYWMIPAIEIKRSKVISIGKTDKSDSKDIAFYTCTHLHKLRLGGIPGVRPQTAIYLIIDAKGFKAFENSRQLACYAGVAPFEYSSGSSIKGRTKVNHLADKKMKSLLYMCAMNAKNVTKN